MRYCVLIISFILSLTAAAQQTVTGRVVDAETGEPLPYVSIYVTEGKGTLSNDEGDFSIDVLPEETLRFHPNGSDRNNRASQNGDREKSRAHNTLADHNMNVSRMGRPSSYSGVLMGSIQKFFLHYS